MARRISRVFGFDARVTATRYLEVQREFLESELRQHLLLRRDIILPLSIDTNIWPSVFSYLPEYSTCKEEEDAGKISADYSKNPELWINLDHMTETLHAHRCSAERIAVVIVLATAGDLDKIESMLAFQDPHPTTLPSYARLLGFDVANAGFVSGLSNCGYLPEDEWIRDQWKDRINDNGLLVDEECAWDYMAITEKRTKGHGPFYVFGIYSLGETG